MKKNIFIFIVPFFLFACTDIPKKEVAKESTPTESTALNTQIENLKTQIMAVHDEVMPLMNKTEDLEKNLKTQLEKEKSKKRKDEILEKLGALRNGEKEMYKWMDEYKGDLSNMNENEKVQYLTQELEKVSAMASVVLKAYKSAEK